ncbi:MAG: TatD family hydrolase [Candidatus Caldipriscus sp.]
MQIFDPHIHFQSASLYDLELMSLSGVKFIVGFSQPAYRFFHPETYLDHYERLLRFEKARAESVGIKTYLAMGISPKAKMRDPLIILESLENYLKLDVVVAIGECGIEDIYDVVELETLKVMFELGRRYKKPVFVDLPEEGKRNAVKKVLKLAEEADIPANLVVLNGIDVWTALDFQDLPVWFCFNLHPNPPKNLTQNVLKGDLPLDRILISSNFDPYAKDPLLLPKAVLDLKLLGYEDIILEKVFYENPKRLFGLS